ncbi:hypothetical protein TPER_HE00177 [Candidatus Hoaglandella endobia]|uniref:Uncharacterized protein n=1 Tax=Candidatus Hoaglandella endobia TaxID=1778263 RepID=A0A143WTT2_9ENTR|nr:hypothetical protein TPER_HE00177 [Candidatus Hoaglandella endobia]
MALLFSAVSKLLNGDLIAGNGPHVPSMKVNQLV